MEDNIKLKTFIRWPGNKSKHINKVLPYLPNKSEYDRYVEPFLGSGAMFLALRPKKWIINDLNKDCINCWKAVRDDPDYIIEEFKSFGKQFKPLSKEKKVEWCREITSNIDSEKYDIDRAIDFMLMKNCVFMGNIFKKKFYFQGLDLHVLKNKFPFLSDNTFNNILEVNKFLDNKVICNTDYKKILKKTKKGDFVFLDPPYVEDLIYDFKYNKNEELNNDFILELRDELKKLDRKGILWMMTQADTKEVKDIFKNYNIKKFPVYRNYNNKYKNELLIMNY
jgi:DNA adenine methylase